MILFSHSLKCHHVVKRISKKENVIRHRNNIKKGLLILSILLMGLLSQPAQAHAWSFDFLFGNDRNRREEHRDRRYSEVVVGSDRYYYNEGVFYRGDPGHYVVTQAPVGAVVYSVPSGYERIEINGVSYVRYGNVYYRPAGSRYEVVRIEKSHDQGDNHMRDRDNRNEHRVEHHGGQY
ncbi:MAG: hypothetical protein HQL14_08370 [Candidatus Omnitrophica bacterium]|nr:hypothetical protein [Candidatus Omnitrophota bacterium]